MEFTTRFGLHSQTSRLVGLDPGCCAKCLYGPYTLSGLEPQSGGLETLSSTRRATLTPQFPSAEAEGFGVGLFPVHSPLLGESWLVSFPPLINMLKFSG